MFKFLTLCLVAATANVAVAGISYNCKACIREVEGGTVGLCNWDVNSYSCGPYQIKLLYWCDAFWKYPCGSSYEDDWKTCTKQFGCSDDVVDRYMNRWKARCTGGRRTPTCRDYARLHNGGYNGCSKSSTIAYANSVDQCCNRKGGC